MTGGGFGGSTVSLVRRDRLEAFQETLEAEYTKRFKRPPTFYVSEPGGGAEEITSDE